MGFWTRNCYYLRISERTVLPLYLYLDERHLDWMSDVVLQHVLSDLRPRVLPKLQAEPDLQSSSASTKGLKTSTVDTHRGENYQFCYFIRNVEPHSVLVKSRQYVAAPPKPKPAIQTPPVPKPKPRLTRTSKRKAAPAPKEPLPRKKKLRTTRNTSRPPDAMDQDAGSSDEDDIYVSSGSEGEDDYMEEDEDPIESDSPEEEQAKPTGKSVFDLEEEEEEKPKPILQLKYQGFSIYGKSLCVVVEPYPLPPKEPKLLGTVLGAQERSRLSAPPQRPAPPARRANVARGETPLFLPDESDEVPEFPTHMDTLDEANDSGDDSDDDGDPFKGMLAFTQSLKNAGENRPGAVLDDDDMDSAVLFGDADEVKEL